MSLLSKIEGPEDIRSLPAARLYDLAAEIRREIIETVSRNGGHLAPNLGVVELTLALHRVFKSPEDKIIWDVGHQCYVHKLITGRRDRFRNLRKYGGISGFPSPGECEHDAFVSGHSSTSISVALGMAIARDLKGEKHSVVAVIGDGAMTGGMAFEAMNHAGHLQKNMIVVLNDNEMSIARNVGGMARYLARLRTDPMYSRGKEELEQILRKIPAIGPTVLKAVERLKDSLKYLVVPGMLFEELGFVYLGPIDGHNIEDMVEMLKKARSMSGPVLVHVVTVKGRGYSHAEKNPGKFHGVGPFNLETGEPKNAGGAPTYTEVFGRTMCDLAARDSSVLAITAAMTGGTGLTEFARKYPDRFFDVGIAEQHAVTMAAAMASRNLRPVVAIYSTFLQRAFDQIIHDVCLQNLPVTFAVDRGGLVGDDGPTHHGTFDLSYLGQMPNMVVMAPKDENELRHMIYTALKHNGPAAVRYPRGEGRGCPLDDRLQSLPLGRAEVIREGGDVALFAVGTMVETAEKAAEELEESHGISAAVVNARFVKPVDSGMIIKYAGTTGRIITIEENVLHGGFGSRVLEVINNSGITGVKVKTMGLPDLFAEHGDRQVILAKYGLTVDEIVMNALKLSGPRHVKVQGRRLSISGGNRLDR
ncbi:MAG: 1-deoxy-D-xylulose-5-phosphate synthase [Peptococcaceae bacterium]|nr:1-deoxy-D-xylulose-5-phosphate synthase [Peptococcaceae bacterium]